MYTYPMAIAQQFIFMNVLFIRDFFPSTIELVATPNPTDLIGQGSGLVWQLTPSTNQISRVWCGK